MFTLPKHIRELSDNLVLFRCHGQHGILSNESQETFTDDGGNNS